MAQKYPSSLKACHFNIVPAQPPSITSLLFLHVFNFCTSAEIDGWERIKETQMLGLGYYHLQSAKPQTIGYLLADSPVGLLTLMYEKLHDWTDNYPGLPRKSALGRACICLARLVLQQVCEFMKRRLEGGSYLHQLSTYHM